MVLLGMVVRKEVHVHPTAQKGCPLGRWRLDQVVFYDTSRLKRNRTRRVKNKCRNGAIAGGNKTLNVEIS